MISLYIRVFTYFSFVLLIFLNFSCTPKTQQITDSKPVFQQADEKFANVYKILDGTWLGEFTIYEDPNPKPLGEMELKKLTTAQIQRPELKVSNKINVKQIYTSETPYYQTVTITDTYPDTGKQEESHGANKIENGEMWCVVNKPTETIIHKGSTDGPSTIIWQSKQTSPQKIEYFYETVDEHFYEIIGYGYYSGDDISLTPRLWFYGKYARQ